MDIIVAVDKNYGIGKDGKLLFHIPEDMRYFRRMTEGKTVIMGRKTLGSLPNGAPLKNRRNIVFSRDKRLCVPDVTVVDSVSALASILDDGSTAMVIGGETIYAMLMDYCTRAYVTKINAAAEADSFFPNLDALDNWVLESASEEHMHEDISFRFCVYRNLCVKQAEIINACGYMTERCLL